MNKNKIITNGFSNRNTEKIYDNLFQSDDKAKQLYERGCQCGSCSYFAELNKDYGLCCYMKSDHYLETIFEHFTCSKHIEENWNAHSFSENHSII